MQFKLILTIVWAACALLLGSAHSAMAQEMEDAPHPRWWGGLGLGYGYVAADDPAPAGESGVWVQLQGGFRVGQHCLLGMEVSGVGIDISRNNYDPNDQYSSVYGQSFTNVFALGQYAPSLDGGWLFTVGAGELIYDNQAIRQITHADQNATGWAGLVRAGYDWHMGHHGHYGVDLSYERGDVDLASPFEGKFGVSMLTLGFHYTYR